MQPKHPFVWLLMFSVTMTLLYFYVLNTESTIIGSIIFSVVTGILTLGLLYGGEKVRQKWFVDKSKEST
jgi:hypothetical protein